MRVGGAHRRVDARGDENRVRQHLEVVRQAEKVGLVRREEQTGRGERAGGDHSVRRVAAREVLPLLGGSVDDAHHAGRVVEEVRGV